MLHCRLPVLVPPNAIVLHRMDVRLRLSMQVSCPISHLLAQLGARRQQACCRSGQEQHVKGRCIVTTPAFDRPVAGLLLSLLTHYKLYNPLQHYPRQQCPILN